ncbi:MAG: retropepsin-like aspartic protease [Steroidobacteraceae bacterium]
MRNQATTVLPLLALTAAVAMGSSIAVAQVDGGSSTTVADTPPTLQEITVTGRVPRYVAPTLRDRIGRIWAPVYLNGKGPFRLVLDTGASQSAIIPRVAQLLGDDARTNRQMRVQGVSGTAIVPVLRIDRMDIGDLVLEPAMLPVVADVFGGADGVLGNAGLHDKRIFIDFRNDIITVKRSRRDDPGPGYRMMPIKFLRNYLMAIDVRIGRIPTTAIIDTGSAQSLGNLALQEALKRVPEDLPPSEVIGVTLDVEYANRINMPTIYMDQIMIKGAQMSFGDVHLFKHWRLTREPAILLGMDVIGTVEQLIIDYPTRRLYMKLRR